MHIFLILLQTLLPSATKRGSVVCNKAGWLQWLYTYFNIDFKWVYILSIKSRELWRRNIPAVNFQLHCILSTFINSSPTSLHLIWFGIYIYTPYFWNWKLLGWLHNRSGFQDKLYFYMYKFLRDTLKVLWLRYFREVDTFLFQLISSFISSFLFSPLPC
jgi:hypothetical protein